MPTIPAGSGSASPKRCGRFRRNSPTTSDDRAGAARRDPSCDEGTGSPGPRSALPTRSWSPRRGRWLGSSSGDLGTNRRSHATTKCTLRRSPRNWKCSARSRMSSSKRWQLTSVVDRARPDLLSAKAARPPLWSKISNRGLGLSAHDPAFLGLAAWQNEAMTKADLHRWSIAFRIRRSMARRSCSVR
jgi:hypothetical protein